MRLSLFLVVLFLALFPRFVVFQWCFTALPSGPVTCLLSFILALYLIYCCLMADQCNPKFIY